MVAISLSHTALTVADLGAESRSASSPKESPDLSLVAFFKYLIMISSDSRFLSTKVSLILIDFLKFKIMGTHLLLIFMAILSISISSLTDLFDSNALTEPISKLY